MNEKDTDDLLRQSRLVRPTFPPRPFPEGSSLIKGGLAGATAGVLIAFLVYVLVYLYR